MSEALLEEYKTLRDEIKRNEKEGLQIILFLIASTFTVLGFIKVQEPLIPIWLIALLIQTTLIVGFTQYLDSLRLRSRISKYIEVFIESKEPELNWETRHSTFSDNRIKNDSWFNQVFRSIHYFLLNVFSILFIGGAVVSGKALIEYDYPESTSVFCFLSIVLIVLNLSNLYLAITSIMDRHFNSYEKKCLLEWKKIKAKTDNSSVEQQSDH